ncbi:hypothetical protein Tcan_06164 [Toxocara canis]|uniref:Uncharacterized protein n=1 Tax=Toxocara canis TaxID=6265 RepID=A0A0B2V734_TOXCA|nr:hypothetical protein Tcan_06164 [Toxocara canis]
MSFSKEIRGLKPENVKFELHNGTAVNESRTDDDINYRRGRRRMLSLSVPLLFFLHYLCRTALRHIECDVIREV